jgi:hypothetical protein
MIDVAKTHLTSFEHDCVRNDVVSGRALDIPLDSTCTARSSLEMVAGLDGRWGLGTVRMLRERSVPAMVALFVGPILGKLLVSVAVEGHEMLMAAMLNLVVCMGPIPSSLTFLTLEEDEVALVK